MEPWNDATTEEQKELYKEIIVSLHQLYGSSAKPKALTSNKQAQILRNVQTRLAEQDGRFFEETSKGRTLQEPETQKSTEFLPHLFNKKRSRTRSTVRLLSTYVATFIAVALICATWFLFNHASSATDVIATTSATRTLRVLTTVHTQANGLEASMQITSGPYFLSELLEANVSLTNHTKGPFDLQGQPQTVPCDPALFVNTTGGTSPYYTVPATNATMSCSTGLTHLDPGQTIHIRQDIPLTMSGQITLTLGAKIEHIGSFDQNGKSTSSTLDPLANRWPVLHISVVSKIPSDRVISLQWHGLQVMINAPITARSNLRYFYKCQDFLQSGIENVEGGNFIWTPLKETTLSTSQCSGPTSRWTFAVGAPGYSIVNGIFPF